MILLKTTEYTKKLICSLKTLPWVEAVKNGKRKTKKEIKSEGSNLNVFLIRAWKCFSLRKSLQTCIKLHSFFCLFLPTSFSFSFVFGNGKERRRTPCWAGGSSTESSIMKKISPRLLSGRVHLQLSLQVRKSSSHGRGEGGDWISRWISDRLFSSDRLCTTCLSSPCRTPFCTSSPPHGVSWFLVLISVPALLKHGSC